MDRRSASVLVSERGPGNCYGHERNDEMMGGPGPGPGPGQGRAEGEESQPPSAKAYKVGEEDGGAGEHAGAQRACVRMDAVCRRGRGRGRGREGGGGLPRGKGQTDRRTDRETVSQSVKSDEDGTTAGFQQAQVNHDADLRWAEMS